MYTGTVVDLPLLHSKAVAVPLMYGLRIREEQTLHFRDSAVFVFGLEKCYFVVDGFQLVTSGKVGLSPYFIQWKKLE